MAAKCPPSKGLTFEYLISRAKTDRDKRNVIRKSITIMALFRAIMFRLDIWASFRDSPSLK